MKKDLKWLIDFVMANSNKEFETQEDFLVYVEGRGIEYDFTKYKDTELPNEVIVETLEILNLL